MNKDNIYKIIGYNGEYSNNVKKAIRKLLKENHPDNNGNSEIFKLINEVKNELEANKVTYKPNKKTKEYDDIDYDYCNEMIIKLKNKKKIIKEEFDILKEKSDLISNEYKKYYEECLQKENILLSNKSNNNLTLLKNRCILILILLIFSFVLAIIKNNMYLFILFGLLSILLFLEIYKLYNIFQEITKNNKYVQEYVIETKKVNSIRRKKEELNKELYKVKRNLELIDNDIRFYNNLLKKE